MIPADRLLARALASRTLAAWLLVSLSLLAGCSREAPKAPEKGPVDVTVLTVQQRGCPGHRDLRRADAELAGSQHPGARLGLARQARVRRRLGRQERTGPVPDGPEAVPGAGRRARRRRCSATRRRCRWPQQNLARTKPLTRAERAVAKGPRRRDRAVPAGRGRRRAGEGATRGSAAQPLLHDDPLARRRRVELCGRRRRHVPESDQLAAYDRLGADADVDQFQRVRKRDGAHPQRRPQRTAEVARRRQVRRRDRDGRRQPLSVHGRDHVRRSVVQRDDGHVPAARDGQQSRRRAAARISTFACGSRARSGRTRSWCRSARCSRARRATSCGSSTRTTRPSCGPSSSASGRATAGSFPKASTTATRSSSTAASGSTQGAPVKAAPYAPTAAARPHKARRPEHLIRRRRLPRGRVLSHRAQATLDTDAQRAVRVAAAAYVGIGTQITITGYADKTGNAAANVDLAKKRAIAVRDELVELGVEPEAHPARASGQRDGHRQRRPGPARRLDRQHSSEAALHVLEVLHRAPGLRGGRRAHHLPRRPRVDERSCRSRSTRASRRCR